MSWEDDIWQELKDCLELFPEIKDIELIIVGSDVLNAALAHCGGKRLVLLMVPEIMRDKPKALRPLIIHELSHMISRGSDECDRIFNQRADERSKALFGKLRELGALSCEDLRI